MRRDRGAGSEARPGPGGRTPAGARGAESDPGGRSSRGLDPGDEAILERVDAALERGRQLHAWWREVDRGGDYAERFEIVTTSTRPDDGFGFFDVAPIDGRPLRVMGDVQDLFYDRPKSPGRTAEAAEWSRRQVRAFALGYFLRIADFRRPEPFTLYRSPELPPALRPLSWCPDPPSGLAGFGYSQLYYRLRDGEIGEFPPGERSAVVDLRTAWDVYDWIVLEVRIFDFELRYRPFGPESPAMVVPLTERQLVVMTRDFVADETGPEDGVLGRYGFGYAVVEDPSQRSVLAYGPGHFQTGFQRFTFEVSESGAVRLRLAFVVNRPERLVRLTPNPFAWGSAFADTLSLGAFSRWLGPAGALGRSVAAGPGESGFDPITTGIEALNWLSGDQARQDLCISLQRLERLMLLQHYRQNHELVGGSLLTFRQIPDWLDEDRLPRWVVSGVPE